MFWELIGLPEGSSFFVTVVNGAVVNPAESSFLFWIIVILGLFFAISVHEFAHAYAAHLLGDDTAKVNGRITINPFKHFDLFGFLLIMFSRFGYGKPVPVNPNNFRNPVQGMMYTALAGPASNIAQAILCGILFLSLRQIPAGENFITTLTYSLGYIGVFNLGLAIFNLLPFAPLDGSKIWGYIHYKVADFIYRIQPYGIFILIFLIYPMYNGRSILSFITDPIALGYFKLIDYRVLGI